MRHFLFPLLILGLSCPGQAQRLLWENTYSSGSTQVASALIACTVTPAHQLLVCSEAGGTAGSCQSYQAVYRLYDLTGALLHNAPGPRIATGDQAFCAGAAGRYWWVGMRMGCGSGSHPPFSFMQRLTSRGDTLAGGPVLALPPPLNWGLDVLAAGKQLLIAGTENTQGANLQLSRYTLTAVDTATRRVVWRYAYNRPGFANDVPIGLTRTPRGGYLLTGDGQVLNSSNQHLLLETDSLGQQLKQRMIYPLGLNYVGTDGARRQGDLVTNILTLPNAQGYLTTGVADSMSSNGTAHNQVAYLMRLDTALNVTWVYRNPTGYMGNGNLNQRGSKVRLLGNSAVYLARDVRGNGTPDLYAVQVDIATGHHLSTTVLSSNTQSSVIPFDWDFVGDGTLIVCGKSEQLGVGDHGWLALYDLHRTALAIAPAAGLVGQVTVWPNPAQQLANVTWPTGVTGAGGHLELRDALGRLVLHQTLNAGQQRAELALAGVPAGVYVLRLLGTYRAVSKRLVVE